MPPSPSYSDFMRDFRERTKALRRSIIEIVYHAKSGHPGGALGMADVYAALHYYFLKDDPHQPHWPDRDRFLLSNGHICPVLYAILAEKGYFPREELLTFRKLGSRLQGHPSTIKGLPGIELSSGSLGNGLSVALGVALARKLDRRSYRVYCGISDGECQEGQPWEAAMAAAQFKLGHLCAIVDYNHTQIDGDLDQIMSLSPFPEKWRSFGWNALDIDGHDPKQIYDAFRTFCEGSFEKPTIIIARTKIGKGVSFMEGDYHWHHGVPNPEQYRQAMEELK